MKRLCTLLILALGSWSVSQGGIVPVSDDFSNQLGTFGSWTSVGSTATVVGYQASLVADFDKYDRINATGNPLDGDAIVGNLAGDTEATGDGIVNDGGLIFDVQNSSLSDEAIGLTIGGTMDAGEQIVFSISVVSNTGAYSSQKIQLYNLTDNLVLAESSGQVVVGYTDALTYSPKNVSVGYTALTSDVGDTLQIRIVEQANQNFRDGYYDSFSVVVVPEPGGFTLIAFASMCLVVWRFVENKPSKSSSRISLGQASGT